MENGSIVNGPFSKWRFNQPKAEPPTSTCGGFSIRSVLDAIYANLDPEDSRPVIPLGHGDPSAFPSFRTVDVAVDAVVEAVRSSRFNSYAPSAGILPARKAVAEYLSQNLPYNLSPDDVYMTVGCSQAAEIAIEALARPGANILLPRPSYPHYELCAARQKIEIRHFDLQPEIGWEVDLDLVENLADENTVAIVIINPGNPCGNVYTDQHLKEVAETASKLGIVVIADEVYGHLTFGSKPFVPMAMFGSIVPVLTLGSISKRWVVPGWRVGWLVTSDPNDILHKCGFVDSLKDILALSCDPATVLQAALPQILGKTGDNFFLKIKGILRQDVDICYDVLKEIPCISCPYKPEGSMSVMAKLDLSMLHEIKDDLDFCVKLAKEESVIALPGVVVGQKNWIRVTFAVEPSALKDGLGRLKAFCERHTKG